MVKTKIFPFNPIQTQCVRTLPLKLQAWGNTSTFLPSVKEGIQSPNGSESTHSGNTDRESPPEFWLFTVYSLLSHHTLPILVFLNCWCSMFFKKILYWSRDVIWRFYYISIECLWKTTYYLKHLFAIYFNYSAFKLFFL